MKPLICALATVLIFSASSFAREGHTFELSPGFIHISGNQGVDGLDAGAAYWFTPRVAMAFDYDAAWDSSNLGAFATTAVGLTTIKSRVQDFLIGPRIGIPGLLHSESFKGHAVLPYFEVQLGASFLNSTLKQQNLTTVSSSDHGFTWEFGGGTDIKLSESARWFARVKVDLLRTHFISMGESRVRFGFGVAHTFGSRP
jgi:hypothetical protein